MSSKHIASEKRYDKFLLPPTLTTTPDFVGKGIIPTSCNEPKHFLNQSMVKKLEQKVFSLASSPGSGNTFTRLVLESVTRLYTGSVYNDKRLKATLRGESLQKGVLFVKTHYPCNQCFWLNNKRRFNEIEESKPVLSENFRFGHVFVLRNPFKAFGAEFQRNLAYKEIKKSKKKKLSTGAANDHTVQVNLTLHEEEFNSKFIPFLDNSWILSHEYYMNRNDTFVIYFEDLLDQTIRTLVLRNLATFVNSKVNDQGIHFHDNIQFLDIPKIIECSKKDIEDGSIFRRTGPKQKLPFWSSTIETVCPKLKPYWNTRWGDFCDQTLS